VALPILPTKSLACALGGLVLAGALARAQQPATAACTLQSLQPTDSLAIVLSGGGAHGLAHIGVLQVLDSLGVRPTLVVGTSMGAVIGAMYASGMSARQIDSVVRQLPLEELFRRSPSMTFVASGDLAAPIVTFTPAFAVEQLGTTVRLQSPAARERQINALLDNMLLGPNIAAAGDFSRLPIPFVAVATEIRTRAPVLLDHGDLAQAVRASAAIPVVFAPVARDEQILIDGGLSANVPVRVARARGAHRLIISDVGDITSRDVDVRSTTGMLSYLLDFLFDQPYDLAERDLAIRPPVAAFGLLDFSHRAIGPLISSGYTAARASMASCQPVASRAPSSRVASAEERRIGDRLARLLDEGFYESVWLNPRRRDVVAPAADTLLFSPVATVAPGRVVGVGVRYDNHEGIRVSLASVNSSLREGRLSASAALSLGEWRQQLLLAVTGLRRSPLRTPNETRPGSITEMLPDPRSDEPPWSMLTRDLLRPTMSLTAAHETIRLYDAAGHELARPSTRDAIGMVGARAQFSGGWQGLVGPIVHLWRDDASGTNQSETAAGGLFRVARLWAPRTSGPDQSTPPAIVGELFWTDHYRRALASADLITEQFGFQLRPRASFGAGRALPLSAQLRLGGSLGFPGLLPDERRGDRAGFAALAISHALLGPIHWRVEVGRGYTQWIAPSPVLTGGWATGAEAGLAADTPIGPLTISYGVATAARRVFKLRVGG
jgi:predicted acylesterase/phospholipase RssA